LPKIRPSSVTWSCTFRGMRLPRASFALAAGLLIIARRADAEPEERSRVRLSYVVHDSGCPDETTFRDLVSARLGYDPFVASAAALVVVEIGSKAGRLEGRAEVQQSSLPSATRSLSASPRECEPLATALATAVAIALDATTHRARDEQALSPTRAAALPVSSIDTPEPEPPAAPRSREAEDAQRTFWLGSLGGSAATAVGPGPMLGLEAGLSARRRALSLEVSARAESTVGVARGTVGDRLEANVFAGTLSPCAHFGAFAGCVFARLGVFQGRAPDVTNPKVDSLLYAAVGFRAAYAIPLGRAFWLRWALEGGAPLVRTTLTIDGTAAWVAPPVFAGASVAVVANIP
jgi:hypothetical protein